ncbi:alpha-glucosidase C-terminal domain-containing protein [Phototrophicus methaneseepsis]|uniref:Alpha-glucosidase C-terminal domain-containing protein n=2 Tax=Phototrophicus methaneseepsis TaxID=2710758 RepID=A0A7S8EEB0_9CHLR|nr:alpha-glucosidase C-terminal domain-containing protein [Phototrophicus methaneseepsis]
MTPQWVKEAIFYHIYPLGLCDAPQRNDFNAVPVARLNALYSWLDHIQSLGVNAIYLGPGFESSAHGYDTADYFHVDRRLGTIDDLRALIHVMKSRGLHVILDGVFNHVGRDFWAFRDVLQNGQQSPYCDWFANLTFGQTNAYGDPFSYEGWAGHYDLVKLNLRNPDVKNHLLEAARYWIETFDIDGLRLDAADSIDFGFFRDLRTSCNQMKSDFWLMGEVVHGDYRQWANPGMLDATTNYECYKGLYSSHADCNYFEIAYSLNRQFGEEGLYRDLWLYNFADNHDVDRVASQLQNPAHLYTLYGLLFTMPGVPSIYYGSEWGIEGERTSQSDKMLRPALSIDDLKIPQPDLPKTLQRFASIRRNAPALKYGSYRQRYVTHEQFAFERQAPDQTLIIVLNASSQKVEVPLESISGRRLVDLLNPGQSFDVMSGKASIDVDSNWLRILQVS